MTKGIQVIWFGEDGNPDKPIEIEYFYGIDVDQIDQIPRFNKIPAVWPRYRGGTPIEYIVPLTRCEYPHRGEARLIVQYGSASNPELVQKWGDDSFVWGTNTIILKEGEQCGICRWRPDSGAGCKVEWKAFDLEAGTARTRATYLGSRREAQFRNIILACDSNRCVLTKEKTRQVLEAAHLIPAAKGENDIPSNGIALRADLHRLFDAGLFIFDTNGDVVVPERRLGLSPAYRRLLRNKRDLGSKIRRKCLTPVFIEHI